ncbi:MAG: tripartite tricarboxylate transporter substrate binding protein [Roseomonas sp.]|jgi:tripartite-type tricarboxylate transporter receptor subunit TctC|nr:tripartite tricarboxylate transporter substrate binding protein [Roseomonas sp.]MCA3430776.1 tripartite tricarboxylate transporter substrate binding protein [Roseomonas sp.]MCA3433164.1 tripartite tricarboxylate transporter substrate binding protein [Roseomonas sp.]MCZ8143528.1 tripartite tricarboxylate transporter substrate-binding protein [Acetobacteraceae bacterium]
MRHSLPRRALLSLPLAALAAPALAQSFPQRNITIIVPSAPGGTLDALARYFGQAMAPLLGRSVVVENVGGAGGLIGMQRAARAEADGQTLVFGNMGVMAVGHVLNPNAGFDPRRELAPISMVADVPMVLAASPRGQIRDLQGLLDHIRRNGDKATFGTAGSGTTSHLAPGYLLHLAGLKATLVSYRGAGPAMADLAAGTVDAVIDQTVTMIPAHRGGTAIALAVSAPQRIPQLPDVPSFAEAGLPGFDLVIWNAFAAPAATPAPVIARLAEAIEGAQQDPVLQGRLRDLASTAPAPAARGPEALRQRIASDIAKWTQIIGASGINRE